MLLFTLHRPFFKIASDIFLGVASANIGDHSTSVQRLLSKVCTHTQAVLDPIRAVFLSYACRCMYVCMYVSSTIYLMKTCDTTSQAWSLCTRHSANDSEFVYATLKLMHKLGTVNATGFSLVMQSKDTWKGIGARYAGMKRSPAAGLGSPPVVATAVVVAGSTTNNNNQNNNHNNNPSGSATMVDKSNAASLTSFIMN